MFSLFAFNMMGEFGRGDFYSKMNPALGFFFIPMLIFVAAYIGVCVIYLLDLYHWGMTEKAVFEKAKEDKKQWFKILIIVPIFSSIIMMIPFLGWIAGFCGMIYWIIMVLTYYFSTKDKLDSSK